MSQHAHELNSSGDDDALAHHTDDIEQTRSEMSGTIEAIQERLAPDRLSGEAKDMAADVTEQAKAAAIEAVDHALQEAKTAAQEWSERASVVALEAIDHAVTEIKSILPTASEQARIAAQEATTHAIAETKAAVQEIGAHARAAVRDATIGKVERMARTTEQTTKSLGARVASTVKQNPGPAALTGLGLGWLLVSGMGSGTSGQTAPPKQRQMTTGGNQLTDRPGQVAGQVAGQVHDMADQVQGVAGDIAGQVHDTAASVADHTQETASKIAGQTQETAVQLKEQVQLLPTRFQQALSGNPMAVGAVAVAIGGAAALFLPETQREHQLMGSARDSLVDRAQTGAQDVVQKVQRVTEEVSEAAGKEARFQGLTPEDSHPTT